MAKPSPVLGLWIAGFALAVHVPRFAEYFLDLARVQVGADVHACLALASAIGTALVVGGGPIYIGHALWAGERLRGALAVVWIGSVALLALLMAPGLEAQILGVSLHEHLVSTGLATWWARVAAVAHDLTAAGALLASAACAARQSDDPLELRLYSEIDTLTQRAERAESELAAAQAALASGSAAAAQRYSCAHCGRDFASEPARSGHLRSCPAKAAALASSSAPTEEAAHG